MKFMFTKIFLYNLYSLFLFFVLMFLFGLINEILFVITFFALIISFCTTIIFAFINIYTVIKKAPEIINMNKLKEFDEITIKFKENVIPFLLFIFMCLISNSIGIIITGEIDSEYIHIAIFFLGYFYLILLTTSAFSIISICSHYKSKDITLTKCVVYIVLQLIFLIDIFSYYNLIYKVNKV